MSKTCLKKYSLLLLFTIVVFTLKAATFSHSSWHKEKKELDYTENVQKMNMEKPDKDLQSPGFDFSVLKYPLFILIIIGLIFLIIKILNNLPSNPNLRSNASIYDSDLEERIHEIDLNALLQKALQQQHYQEAIRILFLIQIKSLSENNLIKWEKQKTNYQYQKELSSAFTDSFAHIRMIYERVWFGKSTINESVYQLLQPDFTSFHQKISTNG